MPETSLLYECRLAHRALTMVLEQYGLTDICVRFNPDDPGQVFAGLVPFEVRFYEHFQDGIGKALAVVVLIEADARVVVERIERLVRRHRLPDFRADEVGIFRKPGEADIDVMVDLTEVIETEGETMRTAPRRRFGPHPRPRGGGPPILPFRVIR